MPISLETGRGETVAAEIAVEQPDLSHRKHVLNARGRRCYEEDGALKWRWRIARTTGRGAREKAPRSKLFFPLGSTKLEASDQ